MGAGRPQASIFRTICVFLILATVVVGSSLGVLGVHLRHHRDLLVTSETRVLQASSRELARKLATCESDLRVLAAHQELQIFLETGSEAHRTALAQEFLAFSRSKRTYSQVRLIDETGVELVRVNRTGDESVRVASQDLQNKQARSYFAAVNELEEGEIYVSPLDLNVDQETVDAPASPVLRMGTPIFDAADRRRGMLVLNCGSDDLFSIILQREYAGQVQVLDRSGLRLVGSGPEVLGSLVEGGPRKSLEHVSPETWNRISAAEDGSFSSPTGGIHLFVTGSGGWKTVSYLSPAVLRADRILARPVLLTVGGITLALLALASWLLVSNWSRRKHAEDELRRSEARHVRVLDAAAEGVICTDSMGTIVLFNSAAESIFGRERRFVVGSKIGILMPESAPSFEVAVQGWIGRNGTRAAKTLEIMGQRADGSMFPAALAISEAISGTETIYTAIVSDLTRRKTLEARLLRARKLESVTRLAIGIAHEINTPLQYVMDNIQFLQKASGDTTALLAHTQELVEAARCDPDSDIAQKLSDALQETDLAFLQDEVPKAIQQILDGAGRMAATVRGIMNFAPPLVSVLRRIDLSEAIENTIEVCAHDWKYVAEIETDFDPDLPWVPCLPSEVNHVILNMILNAARAIANQEHCDSEHKGTITIRTRRDGDHAEIRISDTGTGIPEDLGEHIFDYFYTSQDTGQGRGLGLSMAHEIIVVQHGGTIDFETVLGQGTTFIIRLPLEPRIPAGPGASAGEPLHAAGMVKSEPAGH